MTITVVASTAQGGVSGVLMTMTFGTVTTGDVAIAAVALTRTGNGTVTSSNGTAYTQIGTQANAGNLFLGVWARTLTTGETTATASGTGNAQDGDSACVTVVRGVPLASLKISSAATATSANPNSPSLNVGSTDTIVFSIAAQIANNTITTLPSGYSSGANAGATDTRSSRIASALVTGSEQGAEDPGQWVFSGSAQWLAVTVSGFDVDSVYYPIRSENIPLDLVEARRVVVRSY